MIYKVGLNTRDLDRLADYLDNYADTFNEKVTLFLNKLADKAIEVGAANGGDFSRFIFYSKKLEDGTTIYVSATSKLIRTEWYAGSKSPETRSEVISPLLMAEFGSGHYAIENENAPGLGGQGTLNKYGHAFDEEGWYWYAEMPPKGNATPVKTASNGRVKYHSKGNIPTRPLHKAVMACIQQVTEIAQEVFG